MKTPTAKAVALTIGVVMLIAGCGSVQADPVTPYKPPRGPFLPVVVSTPTPAPYVDPETFSVPTRPPVTLPKPTAGSISTAIVSGRASWYNHGSGLYAAAGPALRVGYWRGRRVSVCNDRGTCVSLRLTDWCQCYRGTKTERVIDLSPAAFSRLAPLSSGVVRVTVTLP